MSTNNWLIIIGFLVSLTCVAVVASHESQRTRDTLQDTRAEKIISELLALSKRLETAFTDMASRQGDLQELHKLAEMAPTLSHRLAVLEHNMLNLEKTIGKLEQELASGKRGS